jgi:hypothetical protein
MVSGSIVADLPAVLCEGGDLDAGRRRAGVKLTKRLLRRPVTELPRAPSYSWMLRFCGNSPLLACFPRPCDDAGIYRRGTPHRFANNGRIESHTSMRLLCQACG